MLLKQRTLQSSTAMNAIFDEAILTVIVLSFLFLLVFIS